MKITVNEDKSLQLEEVYEGVTLVTNDDEKMNITMRDSGFEFTYQGVKYSAKEGVLKQCYGVAKTKVAPLMTIGIKSKIENNDN